MIHREDTEDGPKRSETLALIGLKIRNSQLMRLDAGQKEIDELIPMIERVVHCHDQLKWALIIVGSDRETHVSLGH